jgi:hypothetical protein
VLTLVALLFFPAVLAMSLYRMVQLPRDMAKGRKWLNPKHRLAAALSAGTAYAALLACTVQLLFTLAAAVMRPPQSIAEWLSAASVLIGYAFVYLAYEWTYHYALDPRPRSH